MTERNDKGMTPAEEQAYEEYVLRRELRSTKEGRKAVRAQETEAGGRRSAAVKTAGRGNSGRAASGRGNTGRAASGRSSNAGRRRRKRGRKKHPLLQLLASLMVLLAAAGVGLLLYAVHGIPRYSGPEIPVPEAEAAVQETPADTGSDTASNTAFKPDAAMNDYMNIALFGVDSRDKDLLEGNNRSDSIMIMSIHRKTGETKVVSVFRDTVLDVGDGYYTKCNAAYAYGGPSQAVAMLNDNLDLNITDFVTIGFEGLADAIDALGGIELEITEEEAEYINMYVRDMSKELGTANTPVSGAGKQKLNGIQATAYCRIRYTAGDDFKRAQRQRTVLQLTAQKAAKANPLQLYRVLTALKKEVTTSLSDKEMTELLTKLASLSVSETMGFPREDGRVFATIDGQSCIVPDTLSSEVTALHAWMFGTQDYQPSEGVQKRSADISGLY